MIIHFGTQMYGKVDHVPGLFHVGTRFFHVWFIPLIPVGSFLMLDNKQNQGMAIGLSGKSVLFAYLRLGLFIACLVVGTIGIIEGSEALEHRGSWSGAIGCLLSTAVMAYAFYASYRFSRPNPRRALELAERLGIPMEVLATHFARMQPAASASSTDDMPKTEPAHDAYRTDT
jgi:hypothetical protein